MMKVLEKYGELILLILFFSLALYTGPAHFLDNHLNHDFPYGYFASDAFWHEVYADDLKNAGNFRYFAPYYSGGFENVIAINPPLFYHLVVMFSYLTDLEAYDTIYLTVFLYALFSALIMYSIIKQCNRHVACLSLPFMLLIFTGKFKIAYIFGAWIFVAASFFLLAFFWSVSKFIIIKQEHRHYQPSQQWYLLIALFLSAVTLTHTSETVFAVLFIGCFVVIQWLYAQKRSSPFDYLFLKYLFYAGLLTFIASFYYLVIFKFGWGRNIGFYVLTLEQWTGSQAPAIIEFGWLLPLLFIGVVISAFLLYKRFSIALFVSLFMFLVGFSNYAGFGHRAFQNRYFWPLYAAVFFGLVVYHGVTILRLKSALILWFSIVLLFVFSFVYAEQKIGQGLLDPYHWEAFTWIRGHTAMHDKIYFLYGDPYDQTALLANIWRVPYLVRTQDYFDAVQAHTIKTQYNTRIVAEDGAGLPYRKSFFRFGYYSEEYPQALNGTQNICSFDYWVIDKVSRYPALPQYNALLRQNFLQYGATEVFTNPVVSILKNNNLNKTCLIEQTF